MKELLIIDPHVTHGSPTMKSMVRSLPKVMDAGWKVTVWALECDVEDPRLVFHRVPCFTRLWTIQSTWFWGYAHARYLWYRLTRKPLPGLIQASGSTCLWADVIYIQFVFRLYGRIIQRYRDKLNLRKVEWIGLVLAWVQEALLFLWPVKPRKWLVVSRQLAEDLKEFTQPEDTFSILPNACDISRFSPEMRASYAVRRKEMGIMDGEVIFAFACLGGFERKGFPLAAAAVSLLRQRGRPCRLMVIGGRNGDPPDVGGILKQHGITDDGMLILHGRTPDISPLLVAADAFLFPSYCEAFALVEIEAAALGLRLYLTPHYGSEMILREGVNGRSIPWSAEGIAGVLEADWASGALFEPHSELGEALEDSAYAIRLIEFYEKCSEHAF